MRRRGHLPLTAVTADLVPHWIDLVANSLHEDVLAALLLNNKIIYVKQRQPSVPGVSLRVRKAFTDTETPRPARPPCGGRH